MLIARLRGGCERLGITAGKWHAAYFGERVVSRHHPGYPHLSQGRTVRGLLPRCGANMMTSGKGMQQASLGEPTCRRCRRKLGLPNEPLPQGPPAPW